LRWIGACPDAANGEDARVMKGSTLSCVLLAAVLVSSALGRKPDVGFVPTPPSAVARMVEMADIRPGDSVYDLGCGDGRIVIAAAKEQKIKAVGVDIDPQRVAESRKNVRAAGLESSVEIRQADVFDLDLSGADVVFLYLTPRLNARLMPQLRKLKAGARIISYEFDMGAAKPVELVREKFDRYGEQRIYKWVVPWEERDTAGWDIFRMTP
jgi:ubiquinone/menaquinone biosynthesis C-methylase UbiE